MQNKNKANITLAVVFLLFIVSLILKYSFQNSFFAGLLYFVSEAALIGGIADWFAVSALFTRPLGLSWHTALIPSNRAALTESVTNMVKDELLSTESIAEKINSINSADLITAWGDKNGWNKSIGELAAKYVYEKVNTMDTGRVAGDIEIFFKGSAKKTLLSEKIKDSLVKSLKKDKNREWFTWLAGKSAEAIRTEGARDRIYRIVRDWERREIDNPNGINSLFSKAFFSLSRRSKHTNFFTLSALLQNELAEMFEELKNPNHPLHYKIQERIQQLVDTLEKNQALSKAIESWKDGIIDRIQLKEPLEKLVSSAVKSESFESITMEWGSKQLNQYWEKLKEDPETREWIDGILKSALVRIIKMEHYLIGEIVRETLGAFTDERLNKFIEDKVGDDLQWIRINGSIVGGAAGLLLYLFLKLFYDPYILPVVQGWIMP